MLSTKFHSNAPVVHSRVPLDDDQIRGVVPSIFADEAHSSRSERYSYIPTIDLLNALRKEGFEPFMACQTRVRKEDKRAFTKHMVRLRHRSQITGREANEVILVNSHDGSSAYQMLGGVLRFVCQNGLVVGDAKTDIRIPHKGNIIDAVVDGAHTVLGSFERATEQREGMQGTTLCDGAQSAFAAAALALRYETADEAPIQAEQLLRPRRSEDRKDDLWTAFNRVQENIVQGGLRGRGANGQRLKTRAVTGIDQSIAVNRGLWVLAEEMRKLVA